MKHLSILFAGVFAALALAWAGIAAYSHKTLGQLEPVPQEPLEQGASPLSASGYPLQRLGQANQGAALYAQYGCAQCHTQQVRPAELGNDLKRKLGGRASASRDYIRDAQPQLGRVRIGSDLSNVGKRISDANTLMLHVFNARLVEARSYMPEYTFLFTVRPLEAGEKMPEDALVLPKTLSPKLAAVYAGKVILPSAEAKALVAYLQSLKLDYALPEAPLIEE